MSKNTFLQILCCLFMVLLIAGCGDKGKLPAINDHQDVEINVVPPTVEEELEAWVEDSKPLFLAQTRKFNDKQYVLVTYGKKEADGSTVEITRTERKEDVVEVYVKFVEAETGQVGNDVVDYPYALMEIERTELPLTFIAVGAEQDVPILQGIEYLRPIAAATDEIIVFSPTPESSVNRKFTVEGVANLYEGNFQYKVLDDEGKVLVFGCTTAARGEWQYFNFAVEIDEKIRLPELLTLELFTESVSDHAEQNKVQIPLQGTPTK